MPLKSKADYLAGICLGLGLANFILFGTYIAEGTINWGYYALGIVLSVIFIAYWAIQMERKK